jgi:hypothetical protein
MCTVGDNIVPAPAISWDHKRNDVNPHLSRGGGFANGRDHALDDRNNSVGSVGTGIRICPPVNRCAHSHPACSGARGVDPSSCSGETRLGLDRGFASRVRKQRRGEAGFTIKVRLCPVLRQFAGRKALTRFISAFNPWEKSPFVSFLGFGTRLAFRWASLLNCIIDH